MYIASIGLSIRIIVKPEDFFEELVVYIMKKCHDCLRLYIKNSIIYDGSMCYSSKWLLNWVYIEAIRRHKTTGAFACI